MNKHPVHKVLSLVGDIRRDELATSFFMFFTFYLITMSAYIIKPVKISLFLEWLSLENLPWAYLLTALLIGFIVTLNTRLLNSMNRKLYVSSSFVVFIASFIAFWWLFRFNWKWLALIFWFWADVFTATSVTQFWILVHDTYKPRQAKRLIGFLVSGGLLGGISGALLASLLAKIIRTEDLLLICPFLLLISLGLVVLPRGSRIQQGKDERKRVKVDEEDKVSYRKSFQMFAQNRHLVVLSGIIASAIIVTTLIDFQFNSVVKQNFVELSQRTAFLGTFFTILLVFSFSLHVLTTNRILKNFGIQTAILISPIILLIGSVAVFFVPIMVLFYLVVFLKGADKSLAHSLSLSVRELLYIPVAPDIKYKAKVFIDMFVNKLARGFAAVLLLVGVILFRFEVKQISFLVIFIVLLWMGLNWRVTKEYMGIVKKNLQIKWHDADRFISDRIDLDMTKLVFDTLQNKQRSSVLYAMNVFDLIKSEKLSPELRTIISSKCYEIRASSMDSLLDLDGEALLPEMDDAIEEEHIDTQIKEIMSLDVYQELMKEEIGKIVQLEGEGADVAKMEAAKVIGMMDPSPLFLPYLTKLLKDDSPDVLRYALESAGKLNKREFVPAIISHLKNPAVGRVAGRALVEFGENILGTLKDYLADNDEEVLTRKAIPDIMFRIGTQRAADLMAMEMKKRSDQIESELIEALFKLRTKSPNIQFSRRYVEPELLFVIKKCYLILIEMHDLMSDKRKANLVSDLENSLARSLKHVFELLSLIFPYEDILLAYQNISTGTKKAVDYSVELLDNILPKEWKDFLFPLIEDMSFEDKVRRCRKMIKDLQKAETS
jgi:ATP/ADP translocase/HEAT repeat protein